MCIKSLLNLFRKPQEIKTMGENKVWKSQENKFLKILDGVVLTTTTDFAICLLDKHFGEFDMVRYVTSALRTPAKQLEIIIDYAEKYKIPVDFLPCDADRLVGGSDNYVWQDVWSQLLVKGLVINPPYISACLYDYKNTRGLVVPAGTVLNQTPHATGDCFDMSAWRGNQAQSQQTSVDDEERVIRVAKDLDPVIGIEKWVVERANNCLHVQIKHIEG